MTHMAAKQQSASQQQPQPQELEQQCLVLYAQKLGEQVAWLASSLVLQSWASAMIHGAAKQQWQLQQQWMMLEQQSLKLCAQQLGSQST